MNRDKAKCALDEAFADGIKRMFVVLVDGDDEAITRFETGVRKHLRQHAKASDVIETIFPE